jgi:hypothetical protein
MECLDEALKVYPGKVVKNVEIKMHE